MTEYFRNVLVGTLFHEPDMQLLEIFQGQQVVGM